MDYEKLHKDTITKLQEMVNSGKITVKIACGICADFVPESEDEKVRKEIIYHIQYCDDTIDEVEEKRMIAWLEKQCQAFTKKDVDDAYLKGVRDAKHELEKQGEQKPADIPEDFEKLVEQLLSLSDGEGHGSPAKVKEVSAELLRLAKLQKSAWSEEEVEIIDWLVVSFDCLKIPTNTFYLSKVRPFLISLRNKIQPIINTWSEEDEKMWAQVINEIEAIKSNSSTVFEKNIAQDKIDWLKSLKERYTWKPSNEQTEALDGICSYIRNKADWEISQDTIHQLYSLSEQLKKLKG